MTDPIALPPLVDVDQYREMTGTNGPANLEHLLAGASAHVRRTVGWHIAPVITETVVIDGPGTALLQLPTGRLVSLTAVKNNGVEVDVAALNVSRHGMATGWYWSRVFGGVEVTMVHGYPLDQVPDLLALVCNLATRSGEIPTSVESEQGGPVSIHYRDPGLLPDDVKVLDAFRWRV